MTIDSEEGADFVNVFRETFGTRDHLNARAKAERHASKTRKQRELHREPKQQKNFRATRETVAQLKALVAKIGGTETDVIALAIAELAKAKGVKA